MNISLFRTIPADARDSIFVNTVPLMNIISHEIEDVIINNGLRVDFYAGFQRYSYFARQEKRYRRLAAACRRIYVFGLPDIAPPAIPGVEYIPLTPQQDLAREWFLVVDTPEFFSALLTEEATFGQELPKGERRFRGVWTYEAELIGRAYLMLSQALGHEYRPVARRDYEAQNRYLVQISNRLVRRQDRAVEQQAGALHRSALLRAGLADPELGPTLQRYLSGMQQLISMLPSLSGRPEVQQRVLAQLQKIVGEMSDHVQQLTPAEEVVSS